MQVPSLRLFIGKMVKWLVTGVRTLFLGLVVAWSTLAIYYSNLPWPSLRLALALVFAAFAIWALWISATRASRLGFGAAFLAVLTWWILIPPSHDRDWRPEVAVMPRAFVDGDRVRFTGVRDFKYRSRDDFDVNYKERTVDRSHLTGIDFYVSYWRKGPVSHTFLSFVFDNAPPLAVSIETRPEIGEGFNPLASLFKQFELIYVVGEERDVVGVRSNHRNEAVYLYRLNTSAEDARRLFDIYVQRINQLADRPEFYHLLSNSCTINIIRYANAAGRAGRFDIRHLLNGLIDSYLYHSGRIDTTLPFAELREQSRINAVANAIGEPIDFPDRIRVSLPTIPQSQPAGSKAGQ